MLTLKGPEFLFLFAGLVIVVYVTVAAAISSHESRLPSEPRIRDPYAIAYLRGDTRELIRVVALSLGLRNLLNVGRATFMSVDLTDIDRVQTPLEKEVLILCRTPCAPPALVHAPSIQAVVDQYRSELITRGLLADESVRRARWLPVLLGMAILLVIALAKISVAIATGHFNIVFLLLLSAMSVLLLARQITARRTLAGSTALGNLRTLFASLKSRRNSLPADSAAETTLLAAVFGVYVMPGLKTAAWNRLYPTPNSSGGSGCGAGGSSGCGAGGGCGSGGCGGCGS
jgi:uncharacterized protein (TIGR04222 family)